MIERLLLEHGVDMEIRDVCSLGRTALIWATEFGNVVVVELLLEWGPGDSAYQGLL